MDAGQDDRDTPNTKGDIDGLAFVDEGPPGGHAKHHKKAHHEPGDPMSIDGTIARFLHGAMGKVRGALLDNGVQLRWKKHESENIPHCIGVGDGSLQKASHERSEVIVVNVDRIAARDRVPCPDRSWRT